MKRPLAIRKLTPADGSLPVSLELCPPSQAKRDDEKNAVTKGDWLCRFRIVQGRRTVIDEQASGSDALQAIVTAIAGLRWRFDRTGLRAHYLNEEALSGTGLPSYMPDGFGRTFDRHLHDILKKEVDAHARDLEAEHRQK